MGTPKGTKPWNVDRGEGWTDKRGYRWTYVARDGKRVQVREHRAIMERQVGRVLEPWELVHHINGNTQDNRPENLALMTWEEHNKLHHEDASRSRYLKDTTALVAQMREEIQRLRSDRSDLLAALKDVLDYFEQREDADYDDETQRAQGNAEMHEANAIRAAIARAEGGGHA